MTAPTARRARTDRPAARLAHGPASRPGDPSRHATYRAQRYDHSTLTVRGPKNGVPPGGTHLILTAGRLVPAKRHELFVSCTAELVRKHPGARFVIVGEGPLRQKLTGQIDELGLADVVSLLGTRSDLH